MRVARVRLRSISRSAEKRLREDKGVAVVLDLMYITNNPAVARIADQNGVDRIFVDMEYIGKELRQARLDTVKSRHTIDDVRCISGVLNNAELLVRVNPLHEKTEIYTDSVDEINQVIEAGAQTVMLPMLRTVDDAARFVEIVDGRAKTMLLVETPEAADSIGKLANLEGIDEIHIGLNDLHLALGLKFMFELLADGTVERLCKTVLDAGVPVGFGGIARLGYGMLPAEYVIAEHYRVGSTRAILSRSFCNVNQMSSVDEIESLFMSEMIRLRNWERKVSQYSENEFMENHRKVTQLVQSIVSTK